MGRKRARSSPKCDSEASDEETFVVQNSTRKYGLRPRKSQIFDKELLNEEEDIELSDFEDELSDFEIELPKRTKRKQSASKKSEIETINNSELIDYDELIEPGVICNEQLIDYEKIIVKNKIQILPKIATPSTKQSNLRLETDEARTEDDSDEVDEEGLESTASPQLPLQSNETVHNENSHVLNIDEDEDCSVSNNTEHSENSAPNPLNDSSKQTTLVEDKATVMDNANKYWPGIVKAMDDPEKYFVTCNEHMAVLREKAPKAKYHYLIVPKENIRGLAELSVRHIDMIKNMLEMSKKVLNYPEHENVNFKVGFNAQASMFIYNQKFLWLHMHVISDDMQSDDLVLKKQWNAIHSRVFINPLEVIKQLEEIGTCKVIPLEECKEVLNGDAKCHKCDFTTSRFVAMKKHIAKEHNV